MRQLLTRGFLAVILGVGSSGLCLAAEDDGSRIAIIAPKSGETVGETFALKYDLTKGSQAAHGHVYLDGQRQKGFEGTFRKSWSRPPHTTTMSWQPQTQSPSR